MQLLGNSITWLYMCALLHTYMSILTQRFNVRLPGFRGNRGLPRRSLLKRRCKNGSPRRPSFRPEEEKLPTAPKMVPPGGARGDPNWSFFPLWTYLGANMAPNSPEARCLKHFWLFLNIFKLFYFFSDSKNSFCICCWMVHGRDDAAPTCPAVPKDETTMACFWYCVDISWLIDQLGPGN